ncbi:MAG: phosphomannomutase/phosphoglucomutase [Candidatus Nanohaloarchaea archaeon]
MTDFFHAYDLRGKYPEQISEKEAEKVGKAYGTFIGDEKVLVARDGRKQAEKITEAFIKGITSTGSDVVDIGMTATPVLYFVVDRLGFEHGAVVTASHNPPEYTGFKFTLSGGLAMSRKKGMKQIEEIYEEEAFESGEAAVEEKNMDQAYIEELSSIFDVDIEVAANYGNGVTGEIGPEVLEAIGCKVKNVNEEVNGNFPNHLSDPTKKEAQEALRKEMNGEDLGILFDGDGDRAGFIYNGEYISEDEVIALFAERALEEKKGKIVHDLRASKLVKEKITERGGEALESRVGHTFISEIIHEEDAVFAGELSGHYYFPFLGFPWDDGILAACLMCEIVDLGEIDRLEEYPDYPVSPELRIDCPEDRKQKVIEGVKEEFSDLNMTTKDGVKIEFEKGWALVRPSSTEEKMSVRCEADTEEDLEEILGKVESTVRSLC